MKKIFYSDGSLKISSEDIVGDSLVLPIEDAISFDGSWPISYLGNAFCLTIGCLIAGALCVIAIVGHLVWQAIALAVVTAALLYGLFRTCTMKKLFVITKAGKKIYLKHEAGIYNYTMMQFAFKAAKIPNGAEAKTFDMQVSERGGGYTLYKGMWDSYRDMIKKHYLLALRTTTS